MMPALGCSYACSPSGGRGGSQRAAERLPAVEPEEAVPAPEQGETRLARLEFQDS